MDQLRFHSLGSTGDEDLDYGIRDIEVLQNGNDFAVFASTGAYGGMSGYRDNGSGRLVLADTQNYSPGSGASLFVGMSILDLGGDAHMLIGGHGAGRLTRYDITINGQISSPQNLGGVSSSAGPLAASVQADDMVFVASPWGSGFRAYEINGNSLSLEDTVTASGGLYVHGLHEMAVVTVGGTDFLITAAQGQTTSSWSQGETGISSYQINNSGSVSERDDLGAGEGLGLMTPMDMAVASVDGTQYLVLASAQGNSGALSVIRVSSSGNLSLVDHVGDTRDTRFAAAQAVDVIEVDGRTYVVSGGGDDGVSLFLLAPGGRLVHLDDFANTAQTGLDGISDLALAHDGDNLYVLASSQSDPGLTQLRFDITDVGQTRQVSGTASGGGQDDVLVGGNGHDNISGNAGDDILIDGEGRDTLNGGSGEDIFVLVADDDTDRINGFNLNEDKIDLSGWAYFKDPDALQISHISGGVRITWHDERLDVMITNPGPIDLDDVRAAILADVTRIFEAPVVVLNGSNGNDVLIGDWGPDTLAGLGGNDTLYGYDGSDRMTGGTGHDVFYGGRGDDLMYGQDGNDILRGDNGADRLYGGYGNDDLGAGDGDDVLNGDGGHDTMRGENGHDRLHGGTGNDNLRGGNGDDTLTGSTGNDTIYGDSGRDVAIMEVSQRSVSSVRLLSGGRIEVTSSRGVDIYSGIEEFRFTDATLSTSEAANLRYGLTLKGTSGANVLIGGNGHDSLYGYAGNDTLNGEGGNDRLDAGDGNDSMVGGNGNDTLMGGDGNDVHLAGSGTDRAIIDAKSHEFGVAGMGNGWILITSEAGTDRFHGVEYFQFRDKTLTLAQMEKLVQGSKSSQPIPGFKWQGGKGNDKQFGSAGNDTLMGGGGNDLIKAGAGDDRVWGGRGNDTLAGGKGDDKIYTGRGRDRASGQEGDDTLIGGKGDDRLFGGGGDDRALGNAGNDFLKGGGGDDEQMGGKGHDRISGNRGADTLKGGTGNDRLNGGGGSDTLEGGKGHDSLNAGAGHDRLQAGRGNDTLKGGSGADVFIFNDKDGRDRIVDFDTKRDTLMIDGDLVGSHRTGAAIVEHYAEVTPDGVVLDFGGGDVIVLANLNSLAGLANDIELI